MILDERAFFRWSFSLSNGTGCTPEIPSDLSGDIGAGLSTITTRGESRPRGETGDGISRTFSSASRFCSLDLHERILLAMYSTCGRSCGELFTALD